MADDWQVGDLALCVKSSIGEAGSLSTLRKGSVYTVAKVLVGSNIDGTIGEGLVFVEKPVGRFGLTQIDARVFRKITPPAADEFDREVIELMKGKPAKVMP